MIYLILKRDIKLKLKQMINPLQLHLLHIAKNQNYNEKTLESVLQHW